MPSSFSSVSSLRSNCLFSINQTEQQADYTKLLESESQQMATHRKRKKERKQNTLQSSSRILGENYRTSGVS